MRQNIEEENIKIGSVYCRLCFVLFNTQTTNDKWKWKWHTREAERQNSSNSSSNNKPDEINMRSLTLSTFERESFAVSNKDDNLLFLSTKLGVGMRDLALSTRLTRAFNLYTFIHVLSALMMRCTQTQTTVDANAK